MRARACLMKRLDVRASPDWQVPLLKRLVCSVHAVLGLHFLASVRVAPPRSFCGSWLRSCCTDAEDAAAASLYRLPAALSGGDFPLTVNTTISHLVRP